PARAQAQQPTTPQSSQVAAQGSQNWTGTLVDADCKAAKGTDGCQITDATKSFGLQTADGKYYALDSGSNAKVQAALQTARKKTGAIKASVSGSMEGDTLKAEKVEIER